MSLSGRSWVAYAKAPFAGPEAVLAYLSRYTHRVAVDEAVVTLRYKDYRRDGVDWQQVMTIAADEFNQAAQWRSDAINRTKLIVEKVRQYERDEMPYSAEAEVKKLIPA